MDNNTVPPIFPSPICKYQWAKIPGRCIMRRPGFILSWDKKGKFWSRQADVCQIRWLFHTEGSNSNLGYHAAEGKTFCSNFYRNRDLRLSILLRFQVLFPGNIFLFSVRLPFNAQQAHKILEQIRACRIEHQPFPVMISLCLVIDILHLLWIAFSGCLKFQAFVPA